MQTQQMHHENGNLTVDLVVLLGGAVPMPHHVPQQRKQGQTARVFLEPGATAKHEWTPVVGMKRQQAKTIQNFVLF